MNRFIHSSGNWIFKITTRTPSPWTEEADNGSTSELQQTKGPPRRVPRRVPVISLKWPRRVPVISLKWQGDVGRQKTPTLPLPLAWMIHPFYVLWDLMGCFITDKQRLTLSTSTSAHWMPCAQADVKHAGTHWFLENPSLSDDLPGELISNWT